MQVITIDLYIGVYFSGNFNGNNNLWTQYLHFNQRLTWSCD